MEDNEEGAEKINEKEYKRAFGIDPLDRALLRRALAHALDIRKFEIELYWKRAAYFWTLIAAAFAGYFLILGAENLRDHEFLAFVVTCVGFVFTFAWFEVNRGSKKWQENWENHVDMLEDHVTGPLYKTWLIRPEGDAMFEKWVTGPANVSVSKINQIISLFTLWTWLILAYAALPSFGLDLPIDWRLLIVGGSTVAFCLIAHYAGRTWQGGHKHVAHLRETEIISE